MVGVDKEVKNMVQTRKFNGETFHYTGLCIKKSVANQRADALRSKGRKARVTKGRFGYTVWMK